MTSNPIDDSDTARPLALWNKRRGRGGAKYAEKTKTLYFEVFSAPWRRLRCFQGVKDCRAFDFETGSTDELAKSVIDLKFGNLNGQAARAGIASDDRGESGTSLIQPIPR